MNLPNWLPRRIPRPWRWVQTLDFDTLSPEDNRRYWGLVYTCAYGDRHFLVAMPFCLPARWIYWLWCWMRVKRNRWEKALSAEYHRGRLAEHDRMQRKMDSFEYQKYAAGKFFEHAEEIREFEGALLAKRRERSTTTPSPDRQ